MNIQLLFNTNILYLIIPLLSGFVTFFTLPFVINNGNKILINIFDSQNNNIYAFDNNLNLIDGFPKYSIFNGDFDISNNQIEFSFISDNNELEYHLVK